MEISSMKKIEKLKFVYEGIIRNNEIGWHIYDGIWVKDGVKWDIDNGKGNGIRTMEKMFGTNIYGRKIKDIQ